MKTKQLLIILAFSLSLFGVVKAEEQPKMKTTGTVTVKTELGVGRFATILKAFKEEGLEVGKRNHPAPPAEVEITYVTYTAPGEADEVSPKQIEEDLRAAGYRSATIEELASVDPGNSGLADGQKVIAFGTQLMLSPTESLMFQVSIKGQSTGMDILKTSPKTGWKKKGLLIPAVKLKKAPERATV